MQINMKNKKTTLDEKWLQYLYNGTHHSKSCACKLSAYLLAPKRDIEVKANFLTPLFSLDLVLFYFNYVANSQIKYQLLFLLNNVKQESNFSNFISKP